MARPRSGKDWKVPYTIRLEPEEMKEIAFICDDMMSKRGLFMVECLRIGLEELKKRKSSVAEASKKFESQQRCDSHLKVAKGGTHR